MLAGRFGRGCDCCPLASDSFTVVGRLTVRLIASYLPRYLSPDRLERHALRRGCGPDGERENSWTQNGVHLSDIESIL